MANADHWREHARRWALFGPPLRPTREEVAMVERAAAEHLAHRGRSSTAATAIVLGVTPELVACAWPDGVRVIAVDSSPQMIAALWRASEDAHALCADWRALPIAQGTIDLAVGDGSLNALPDARGFAAVAGEVARVLVAAGRFVCRFYLRPEIAEALDTIASDLGAHRIASLHVLKWRLAAALHGSDGQGVRLDDIWRAFREMASRADGLGWSPELIATIDAYRGADTRYYFPTETELRALLSPWFAEATRATFDYPLGERCPTLVLDKLA